MKDNCFPSAVGELRALGLGQVRVGLGPKCVQFFKPRFLSRAAFEVADAVLVGHDVEALVRVNHRVWPEAVGESGAVQNGPRFVLESSDLAFRRPTAPTRGDVPYNSSLVTPSLKAFSFHGPFAVGSQALHLLSTLRLP